MGKNSEGIGVALEMHKIVPQRFAQLFFQIGAISLGKIRLNGLFAGMAKGRIAQIVGKAGGGNNRTDFLEQRTLEFRMSDNQLFGHIIAQRHAHAGHLKRVGEAVMHEDATWQRKHLRLVLQSAEGCRENQAVVVAFKL